MHGSPVQLVSDSEGGPIGDQGEHTLVLGSGRSVVEGGAAQLVLGSDVTARPHDELHTLYVPVCVCVCVHVKLPSGVITT